MCACARVSRVVYVGCDALTVCIYQMKVAWAFAATCFPVLFSGVVKERRFVQMFGCCTWSCLEHVGEDKPFHLGGYCGTVGASGRVCSLFFPPYQVSITQKDLEFSPAGRYYSPGMESSAWTHLEFLQQSSVDSGLGVSFSWSLLAFCFKPFPFSEAWSTCLWREVYENMALGERAVRTTHGSVLMKCVIQCVRDTKKIVLRGRSLREGSSIWIKDYWGEKLYEGWGFRSTYLGF